MASDHQAIFTTLGRFRASWPQRGWSFDNRFQCVASSFGTDLAPEARRLLAPIFPYALSDKTLAGASETIREVAARTGGVRAGQLIFAADPIAGVTPYGLWWPWEEAQTISLRIGLEGADPSEIMDLCTCFNAVL
jgi:hypothetical protein